MVDEYVAFAKKYNDASSEEMLSMMDDYSDYMEKYMDAMNDLYDVDQDELSVKDIMYYSEVMGRIE